MTRKRTLQRVNKVKIAEAAWRLAYIHQAEFTTDKLAAALKMPANRHFRQYLNYLAGSGLLFASRQLDDDGHYRKYFSAQATIPMFDQQGKEKIA